MITHHLKQPIILLKGLFNHRLHQALMILLRAWLKLVIDTGFIYSTTL